MRRGLVPAALACALPLHAQELTLTPPLDCDPAAACYIQQYVDTDPGPGARDFTCGSLSYDGHKGTDFALPSRAMMEEGVDVVAAAPGLVRATRDGMADRTAGSGAGSDVTGRECGNGVVLDHGDGWETQYCHLKLGSIAVIEGATVTAGQRLGQVGLSGQTAFPHVHLSVRRDSEVVDPFAPGGEARCGETPDATLWSDPPAYRPGGIIAAGFSDAVPDYDSIKAGTATRDLGRDAPVVLWAYLFGARAGDVLKLSLAAADGPILVQDVALDRTQAQLFRAVGKRAPQGGWPRGRVTGTATLLRDGRPVDQVEVDAALD
ncbi:M23 family metallopeptidase [Palleronia pelagia]|uniref:Peptidase family M23 n=1 Tax=Palleronia pelagia TaxID=387096 RepID=A0A1H8AT39_9RHOB|nr:M23 family metallopeptidase [Palleronia pelagia]SEM73124.1 Peptidase family M23 [Palleronia pelagia]